MSLYDTDAGIGEYIAMCEGLDGREQIERLRTLLPSGSRVLEIGSGPGIDLLLLAEHFEVTGSDRSAAFRRSFERTSPKAEIAYLDLDVRTLDLDSALLPFAGLYSNKVLHHLSAVEHRQSLAAQRRCVEAGGLALHTYWHGEGCDTHHGLLFHKHTAETLRSAWVNPSDSGAADATPDWEVVEIRPYSELGYRDSLRLIARAS